MFFFTSDTNSCGVNATTKAMLDKNPKSNESNTEMHSGRDISSRIMPPHSHRNIVKQKDTSSQNKGNREMKMVKITVYIIILGIISCFSTFLNTFSFTSSFLISYSVFFNNCGNPVIYLVADKSFRNEVFQILKKAKYNWLLCRQIPKHC